jgi:DNA-binding NarL/FixJ family response regulator
MTINILLIDDHPMFRSGLHMLLTTSMPGASIHEAGSTNDALRSTLETPDVILLDIKLPGLNGTDGIALLRRKWPDVAILMLSSMDESETVRKAMERGATEFISKAETAERIVTLIKQVLCGELTAADVSAATDCEQSAPQHLTPRQYEVLELLCQGLSNKLIARELELSENTVRGHVQAILSFFNVSSRSEASFEARRSGLVN